METRSRWNRKTLAMFFMMRYLGRERKESTHLVRYADGDEGQVGVGETEQEDAGYVLNGATIGEGERGEYPP